MQKDYKQLGDYIQEIDVRNEGLKVTNLLGLTINKQFIPSVANTVGADMEKYKIIRKNQFACSTMQVRRDGKMPVALLKDFDEAIISQAYPVFEVIDEDKLLPDFLMMWFSRTEFDREACFHAVGGVRGSLEWEDFLNMQLPVPSLEKQQEIVSEYNAVQNRINVNNKLIQKLEETAQAIYKQWFVDFEFPDENAKPYKSNGGEMVESELGEIPKGWKVGRLSDVIDVKYGKAYNHLNHGNVPLYGSGGLMGYVNEVLYNKPSILIPRKGTLNNIMFINKPFWCVDTMFYSVLLNEFAGYYLFYFLRKIDFDVLNQGSAVPSMTTNYLNGIQLVLPNNDILKKIENTLNRTRQLSELYNKDNQQVENFKKLLLSKLSTTINLKNYGRNTFLSR